MKKCPFCGADLAENARFCLYCMSSLNDKEVIQAKIKHKVLWIIIAVALVLVLAVGGNLLIFGKNTPSENNKKNKSESAVSSTHSSTYDNDTDYEENNEDDNSTNNTENENEPELNNGSDINGGESDIVGGNQNNTTQNDIPPDNTVPEISGSTTTTPEPTVTDVTYTYRKAQKGDDFLANANIPEDAVVITGVSSISEDGLYVIPEKIDGNTVIAVMGMAFCDKNMSGTIKKVVVPATVKTINEYAFANCYNLSDIYFLGDSIYTDVLAFPETTKRNATLTIHCSAVCNDRNLRYYKNAASYYGAVYKEWDKTAYN